ncbi:MAG: LacI family DNA-binding transcriptional regulator [Lachnospirales bacterium]
MNIKNTVSMQDLADELGVSKVTISKALNDKYGVSDELKKKIFEAAEKHGYNLPDYGKRKTQKIGIIMSEKFNSNDKGKFYMGMYDHIINELRKYSCTSVMITPTRNTILKDVQTLVDTGNFDGLILLGILDHKVKDILQNIELPKVFVDIYDVTQKSDSVVTENIYSSYDITGELINRGHKKIGFVGTVGSTTSITDRYLGYERKMMEQEVEIKEQWIIPDRDENGVLPLVLPEDLPTAFVCNCDETAFQLVKDLRNRGLLIPRDISIVGFDDSVYSRLCEPPLTTVAVNINQIGRVTAKRIMKSMEKPNKGVGEVFRIPGQIIYRDSIKDIR